MAASESKTSPSNHSAAPKDPPLAATDSTAASTDNLKAPPAQSTMRLPTYQDSVDSEYYRTAKALLNGGDFEQALETIEAALEATKEQLMTSMTEDEVAKHESMAAFHYLYGTTLLYSIEESTDQNMTTVGGDTEGGDESGAAEEPTEDTQIAWENLETARLILQALLIKESTTTEQIKLDLAQVCLREGDLQKLNGRYEDATRDYQASLDLFESSPLLGAYDRKIADAHYNLSLVYQLQVAQKRTETEAPQSADEEQLAFCRSRSVYHSYRCAQTLAGQMAFWCGEDPAELLAKVESELPSFKSTGEDELSDMDHPRLTSLKLQKLRHCAAQLNVPDENSEQVEELMELMEEIQETIDEAERSEEGVHRVSAMKAEISAAVAAQPNDGEDESPTNAFGTASAATSTAVAQPIMAVKKKKRTADDAKLPAVDGDKKPKAAE